MLRTNPHHVKKTLPQPQPQPTLKETPTSLQLNLLLLHLQDRLKPLHLQLTNDNYGHVCGVVWAEFFLKQEENIHASVAGARNCV